MTRKKMGLIVAFNLMLIALAVLWYRYTPPLSVTCEGNLNFADRREANSFNFEGEIVLRFHPDGSGDFTLNGSVLNTGQSWDVSRQETFRWRHVNDTLYEITIIRIERFSHDALPKGVFEKYVAGLTLGKKRLLTLERTPEEALAIGNSFSPLLICSE